MRAFAIGTASCLLAASTAVIACFDRKAPGGAAKADEAIVAAASTNDRRWGGERDRERRSADSSPFIVGVWKFVPGATADALPQVDSEFRFINPTRLLLKLEYAFFDLNGNFCGCDRDDLAPNKTTLYTIFDEKSMSTPLFTCTGPSGALKAIVFEHHDQRIFLDDATQVGFQTHAFGNIQEADPDVILTGTVMTEAPMQGIAIDEETMEEVRAVHQHCVDFLGPL